MSELWVATGNRGKLNEIKMLVGGRIEVHSQNELGYFSAPQETGETFEDNARIKAKALRAVKKEAWVLADDSGLEVEGLKGYPGVHSARYAGPKASDAENTAKLLKMMSLRSAQKRDAQFRCVMVAYSPEGQEYVFDGTVTGQIAKAPRGSEGFGYDNVFIPQGEEKTFAELGIAFKNRCSHRAQALRKFAEILP